MNRGPPKPCAAPSWQEVKADGRILVFFSLSHTPWANIVCSQTVNLVSTQLGAAWRFGRPRSLTFSI